jgi:hypothetical protein
MPIKDFSNALWVSTSLLNANIEKFKMLGGYPPAFFMPIIHFKMLSGYSPAFFMPIKDF